MRARRLIAGMRARTIAAGLSAIACGAIVGTALAAPASGGRHLPYFSLMNERVGIGKLPLELRMPFGGVPGGTDRGLGARIRGPVWYGEVERPNATIMAAGTRRWVCEMEEADDDARGGGGGCTTLAATRELGNLDVSACGKGPARRFRIVGLVPNGVSGLAIEKADGTVGRTVAVIENTVAFTVGRENIVLHGVGSAAGEGLERNLPLRSLNGDGRPGCATYYFFEAKAGP